MGFVFNFCCRFQSWQNLDDEDDSRSLGTCAAVVGNDVSQETLMKE